MGSRVSRTGTDTGSDWVWQGEARMAGHELLLWERKPGLGKAVFHLL
jgi:hypothetical protein